MVTCPGIINANKTKFLRKYHQNGAEVMKVWVEESRRVCKEEKVRKTEKVRVMGK